MLPIFILLSITLAAAEKYSVPEPKFQLLKPRGFRASISDVEGIRLFAFHGNLNKELEDMGIGQFSGDVMKKKNGRWVFENKKVKLRQGDVINYWIFVMKNGEGYTFRNGTYKCKLDTAVRNKRHSSWGFLLHSDEYPSWHRQNEFSSEHVYLYPTPNHYFNHHRNDYHHNNHHHNHHHHDHNCNHGDGYEYPDPENKFGSDEDEDDFATSTEPFVTEETTTKKFETANEVTTSEAFTNEITTDVVTRSVVTEAPTMQVGNIEEDMTTVSPTTSTRFPRIDIRFGN